MKEGISILMNGNDPIVVDAEKRGKVIAELEDGYRAFCDTNNADVNDPRFFRDYVWNIVAATQDNINYLDESVRELHNNYKIAIRGNERL